jgi:hypothetical protein
MAPSKQLIRLAGATGSEAINKPADPEIQTSIAASQLPRPLERWSRSFGKVSVREISDAAAEAEAAAEDAEPCDNEGPSDAQGGSEDGVDGESADGVDPGDAIRPASSAEAASTVPRRITDLTIDTCGAGLVCIADGHLAMVHLHL